MVLEAIANRGFLGKNVDVVAVADVSTNADFLAYQISTILSTVNSIIS